jgi:hypothetical protein
MISMAIRLFSVVCLAVLVVSPAYCQSRIPGPGEEIAAITTDLQYITENDVDQCTKLDLLLAQKQASREDVINELSKDLFKIAKAERAGLLSDALVDKAFGDMCSRLGVAPAGNDPGRRHVHDQPALMELHWNSWCAYM